MRLGLGIIIILAGAHCFAQPVASFEFSTLNPGNICVDGWTTCNNTSTGATNYFWEMPGCVPPTTSTSSDPGFVTYDTPGIYTITLHAINGVDTSTVSHDLEVHAKPSPLVIGAEDLCVDGFMTLSVTPPPTASWQDYWWFNVDDGGFMSNTLTIDVTTPGSYYISVTDTNTCSVNSDTVVIIDGTPTPVITWGGGTDLVSNYASGNQWYLDAAVLPGETAQVHTATVNGNYTVEVTGSNGCVGASADYLVTDVGLEATPELNQNMTFMEGVLSIQIPWELYDLSGRLIRKESAGIFDLPEGIYILRTGLGTIKLINY